MFELRIADRGSRIVHFAVFVVSVALVAVASAQESSTPIESPSPAPQESPSPTTDQSPFPSPSPTPTPTRNVWLSFVPPPMEGTISLGIFDQNGKLVRVLHREARIDNFTVEADGLRTTWDGKNETGEDLPSGKYRGRGYLVGQLTVKDLGKAKKMPKRAADHVSVTLTTNPLMSDTRSVVDLAIGFDGSGSFIKTMDGLPLFTVGKTPNVLRVLITRSEKSVDIWQDNGTAVDQLRVGNIDQIMAFDCGFVELK